MYTYDNVFDMVKYFEWRLMSPLSYEVRRTLLSEMKQLIKEILIRIYRKFGMESPTYNCVRKAITSLKNYGISNQFISTMVNALDCVYQGRLNEAFTCIKISMFDVSMLGIV